MSRPRGRKGPGCRGAVFLGLPFRRPQGILVGLLRVPSEPPGQLFRSWHPDDVCSSVGMALLSRTSACSGFRSLSCPATSRN